MAMIMIMINLNAISFVFKVFCQRTVHSELLINKLLRSSSSEQLLSYNNGKVLGVFDSFFVYKQTILSRSICKMVQTDPERPGCVERPPFIFQKHAVLTKNSTRVQDKMWVLGDSLD